MLALGAFLQTIIILALISRLNNKRLELNRAREQLKRIAAADNEIVAVLEATDSDLSRRLLAHIDVDEQKKLPAKKALDQAAWRSLKKEMKAHQSLESRLKVLRRWVQNGAILTSGQRASLMSSLRTDAQRNLAAKVLDKEL